MSVAESQDQYDFDPDALREKYREERDKRVRADGNDQYIEVTGDFSHYVDDPYVEPGFVRDPVLEEVEVVVIGGGFGGMLAAARLKDAGIHDVRIIEKGGGFGGTWYWNRYPGASCDIESYVYFPMLEKTGFVPRQKYTNAPETLEYCEVLAERFASTRCRTGQTVRQGLRSIQASLAHSCIFDEAQTPFSPALESTHRIQCRRTLRGTDSNTRCHRSLPLSR